MASAWAKHWRVGLAALVVKGALLALLVWWWQGRSESPAALARQGQPVAASAAQTRAAPPVSALAAASALPATTRLAGLVVPAERALGPERLAIDLCGVGLVEVKRPAPGHRVSPEERLPHLFEHALAAAWPQLLAALAQSPAERGRAAGLVLQAAGLPNADNREPREFVRQLAHMASRSRDPTLYQWAWSMCDRAPDTAECRALSPQGWVERAPGDVRGWLLLAAGSPAARDSALRQAAQADSAAPLPALTPWVESAMPVGTPPYLRLELLVQTVGIEAAFNDRAYFFALEHCRKRPDAREVCSALADNVAQRGTDTFSLGIARALGRHSAWTPERLAAVETLDHDLARLALSQDPSQTYSCDSVERHTAWFRDRAELGERAALRQRAAVGRLNAPGPSGAASR